MAMGCRWQRAATASTRQGVTWPWPLLGDDLMRCVDLYNQAQSKWFEEMVTTTLVSTQRSVSMPVPGLALRVGAGGLWVVE